MVATRTTDFLKAFFAAYAQARDGHDDASWREAWGVNGTHHWSHHMLWNEDSVLRATALSLGFQVAPGEPLRLDSVFVLPDPPYTGHRFPIQVAVEHENAPWTFEAEIRVLFAVRAPLKVGITYALLEHRRPSRDIIQWLTDRIRSEFDKANSAIGEDPHTEYLFLVGEDAPNEEFALRWKVMAFTAATGAQTAVFTEAAVG